MGKSPQKKKEEKVKVGPGFYHDGILSSARLIQKSSSAFTLGKGKTSHTITERAHQTKEVPGAGAYKGVVDGFKFTEKKGRLAGIFPYKYSRFT